MKLKPFKRVPFLVVLGVIVLVGLLRSLNWELLERAERMTYDMRVRAARRFSSVTATNLGFVTINEDSVRRVWDGSLGYHFGLYWPRQVYGALVQELAEQGARAVALDIIFGELRPDHPFVQLADGSVGPESDEFFAHQMRCASNVIIAITPDLTPPLLFLTNAMAVGDISTEKDQPEGVLRRTRAFRMYRQWHPVFRKMADDSEYAIDLKKARIEPRQIIFPRSADLGDINVPLDAEGNFELADFDRVRPGMLQRAKPFTDERIWHMGVELAARELNLDLANAEVDLPHGRITLRGPNGLQRIIPVDAEGSFFIDWSLTESDPRLAREAIQDLLAQYRRRLKGQTNELVNHWRGKLAVVGSSEVLGNNLTDRGATPLSHDTLLVSKHWNVANSIITGSFVRCTSLATDFGIIVLLAVLAGVVTWQLPVLRASGVVLALMAGYVGIAAALYIKTRFWLPLVLPLAGACLMTHVCLVTWRVLFEQGERRRVKAVLCTMVSPKIADVLLESERLSLRGARREITVLFADVRGFTQFTDMSQERVADFVERNHLTGVAAEACFDEQARETIDTINLYLGLVANTILQGDGTLDKFIGDCVMAFWGDPKPEPKHAAACVHAAIETQRAIYELNRQREAENRKRQAENLIRKTAGLPLQPLWPILFLGTGINTGMATVGIMGSEVKDIVRQGNYTVFGREVNLASRLEGASGRGRIFVGETTYHHLLRDDPALAATCVLLPEQKLKGISTAVTVYEVPWRLPEMPPLEAESA